MQCRLAGHRLDRPAHCYVITRALRSEGPCAQRSAKVIDTSTETIEDPDSTGTAASAIAISSPVAAYTGGGIGDRVPSAMETTDPSVIPAAAANSSAFVRASSTASTRASLAAAVWSST